MSAWSEPTATIDTVCRLSLKNLSMRPDGAAFSSLSCKKWRRGLIAAQRGLLAFFFPYNALLYIHFLFSA